MNFFYLSIYRVGREGFFPPTLNVCIEQGVNNQAPWSPVLELSYNDVN